MEIKKMDDASSGKKKDFDPVRAIIIIIVFLIAVWLIWTTLSKVNSGAGKDVAQSGFNLASSSLPAKKAVVATPPKDSFYRNFVKIYRVTSATETYPEKEYIEVQVVQANLSAVDITGWKLVNQKGEESIIGSSVELPVGGKVNKTTSTKISGNDVLIISSGRSPVGVSFRLNSCIGYFEQFQDFIPPLPVICPSATYDKNFPQIEQDCKTFVYNIPQCTTNTKPFPAGTSAGCKSFVVTDASYNGCVVANKEKTDFYKPEWRIFLNRDTELWDNTKDTITLLDDKGDLIDSYSYTNTKK